MFATSRRSYSAVVNARLKPSRSMARNRMPETCEGSRSKWTSHPKRSCPGSGRPASIRPDLMKPITQASRVWLCGAAAVLLAAVATPHAQRRDYPERKPGDPAAIARGKVLYGVNCQFCHGADIRGGDSGPSLLRSGLVLDDQNGELLTPVVQNGRPEAGMPKFSFSEEHVADVAAYLHTFRAAGYDESRVKPTNIVVGDAKAGEAFFTQRCASCHSVTGDLRGLASKITDPRLLQQTWLMPGSGGRGAAAPVAIPPARVVVTLPSGEKIEGQLERADDFGVALR